MKINIHELKDELKKYGITIGYEYGRISLEGGNEAARQHYQALISSSWNTEFDLIFDLASKNPDVMDAIEERACIRWAEGLKYDLKEAIIGNLIGNLTN